jgi:hypothetical protein
MNIFSKAGGIGALGFAAIMATVNVQADAVFTFTKIADTATVDPSGRTFGFFGDPSISGSNVAFRGFDTTGACIGVFVRICLGHKAVSGA